MKLFSERMGYKKEKCMQYETMDLDLRNRLLNIINTRLDNLYSNDIFDFIADEFFKIQKDYNVPYYRKLIKKLTIESEWHRVYSFIEYFSVIIETFSCTPNQYTFEDEVNYVLKSEVAGYRLINQQIIPITDDEEIMSIETSSTTVYDAVNVHMKKALRFFSDRLEPDYENSIKESISAVESIACIIMEKDNAILSSALDRLEQKGVRIHTAQKEAFKKLYGYTSDENGIRHAGIDFHGATLEDAKFMLVTCSAFVNYLIEKCNKSNAK